MINTQTGKDYFSFEQNMQLVKAAKTIAAETGIEIVHETHRGKFLYNLQVFEAAAKVTPDLGIALDISHWCTVHESLLQDQQEAVNLALHHTRHIHARIGFEEGPQVNDPRASEWKPLLKQYFKWWDVVVARHKKMKRNLTVTTEFGPAPYMPLKPYSMKPISKQWDINVFMMELFKTRYKSTT
jgi:sugar phosphate isomerase/epimerase